MKMESDSGDNFTGRLEEALKGDAGWYSLPGGADSCHGICLHVVSPWHVEELTPFKISTELLNEEVVARHDCVRGIPIARRLLNHQV